MTRGRPCHCLSLPHPVVSLVLDGAPMKSPSSSHFPPAFRLPYCTIHNSRQSRLQDAERKLRETSILLQLLQQDRQEVAQHPRGSMPSDSRAHDEERPPSSSSRRAASTTATAPPSATATPIRTPVAATTNSTTTTTRRRGFDIATLTQGLEDSDEESVGGGGSHRKRPGGTSKSPIRSMPTSNHHGGGSNKRRRAGDGSDDWGAQDAFLYPDDDSLDDVQVGREEVPCTAVPKVTCRQSPCWEHRLILPIAQSVQRGSGRLPYLPPSLRGLINSCLHLPPS